MKNLKWPNHKKEIGSEADAKPPHGVESHLTPQEKPVSKAKRGKRPINASL